MIGYPAWYAGGTPDVEMVMRDMFSAQLTGVEVVSWVPPDYASHLASGLTYLRVFRLGGRFNVETRVDEARVQFAALSASRDESVRLIDFVRMALVVGCRFGKTVITAGTTAFVLVPGEVVGPQLLPEQLRDERLVATTIDVNVDRRRGLPDYSTVEFS